MEVWLAVVYTCDNIESCADSLRVFLGAADRRGKPIAGRLYLSAVFIHCRRICQSGHWQPASQQGFHKPSPSLASPTTLGCGSSSSLVTVSYFPRWDSLRFHREVVLAPLENPARTPECESEHPPKNSATTGAEIIARGEYYYYATFLWL